MKIENVGFCKPYEAEKSGVFAIVNAGKVTSIQDGAKTIYNATPAQVEAYAKTINSDFALYEGRSFDHILIDAMEEKSCCDCPFFEECEALEKPEKGMIYSDPDGNFEILEVNPDVVTVKDTETGKEYTIPYKEVLYFINFKH